MRPEIPVDAPRRFRKLLRSDEVRAVNVQTYPDRDENDQTFPLAYTRSGAGEGDPVLVIIPGGPGLASVVPYAGIRPKAVAAGFEVVMVEHRGVGLSRKDSLGEDLPTEAMRVEYAARDMLAVLDEIGAEKAWLHGTSYGGYLAQVFGAMFPDRVAGMFLDSTSHEAGGESETREYVRDLFLRGVRPEGFPEGLYPNTSEAAAKVREILSEGFAPESEVVAIVPPVYEFLGPEVLDRVLSSVIAGRRSEWRWFARLVEKELDEVSRYVMEADLAMAIHFRQIHAPTLDGAPFDTALTWTGRSERYPAFEGEPFDLETELPGFDWPVVLFSGERDTRTPPFRLEKMDRLLPRSVHVTFPNVGHDLLRFRTEAVLSIEKAAVREGVEGAARTAERTVCDGGSHPLTLIGRAFGGYLEAREYLARPKTKLALAAGAALALYAAARARRSARRSVPATRKRGRRPRR